ncbi:UNVERIFIED_CONTAM: Retrovirus-related Pol polyprotein from transposon TNT 1-94 [Sesamum radiatum]|uniref:Retrovirus-related Pol polyprotein from transposon TNT 1-94 n=1 Tax=Sesamum radiatum TaxID=300843 RepID=A0AAW2U881_SESRA
MTEGSSVQSHGITMLSLVEKLEDLKAGLDNDTYIDVILQSIPPSYDPFIVNYNMNGLEKSIHELINMLVQYEATTHKSEPSVLVGEASTSKAKGKGARRWKRKKGKGTAVTATASTGGAPVAPKGKGKGKVGGSQQSRTNDVCIYCHGKGHWKKECPQLLSHPGMFVVEIKMISNSASWILDTGCGAHICNNLQVLQRSRKLSKDEMVLRLGDGKAVAAEAIGSLSLVVSNHVRIEFKDCYYVPSMIWHARLGHISKNRIRRLVDIKSLEIDDLDHLPTCESCLKGKMTKKPFVGQSTIAKGLLDLVHTDVCGPLSVPAREGFSYFITFTDDHSRYGYVYLMRFVGYPKETAGYYFYDPTEQKVFVSRNAVFLEKGFHQIADVMRSTRESRVPERLVAKGYTQRPGVDFEETYSPVAIAKSIRILLAIAAWYDYEIWQMDVKTTFLNGFVEEEVFMDQPEGFTTVGEEQKVCRLQMSIYGLKQASRSWNTGFDEVIRGYDFIKNDYDPCVYKKISGSSIAYLVLYVDDILLIGNDVKMLGDIKVWLSTQFSMKDMGEASYILGIKIYRDRSKRMLGLTQSSYIEKVLKRFRMEHSKRRALPIRHEIKLSKKQSPKTDEELKKMSDIPYASAVGSIQYAVQ